MDGVAIGIFVIGLQFSYTEPVVFVKGSVLL
jgi:hypothetical protein